MIKKFSRRLKTEKRKGNVPSCEGGITGIGVYVISGMSVSFIISIGSKGGVKSFDFKNVMSVKNGSYMLRYGYIGLFVDNQKINTIFVMR